MVIEYKNKLEKKEDEPGRKKKKRFYLLVIVGIISSIITITFLSKYYIMFGGVFKIG